MKRIAFLYAYTGPDRRGQRIRTLDGSTLQIIARTSRTTYQDHECHPDMLADAMSEAKPKADEVFLNTIFVPVEAP